MSVLHISRLVIQLAVAWSGALITQNRFSHKITNAEWLHRDTNQDEAFHPIQESLNSQNTIGSAGQKPSAIYCVHFAFLARYNILTVCYNNYRYYNIFAISSFRLISSCVFSSSILNGNIFESYHEKTMERDTRHTFSVYKTTIRLTPKTMTGSFIILLAILKLYTAIAL